MAYNKGRLKPYSVILPLDKREKVWYNVVIIK